MAEKKISNENFASGELSAIHTSGKGARAARWWTRQTILLRADMIKSTGAWPETGAAGTPLPGKITMDHLANPFTAASRTPVMNVKRIDKGVNTFSDGFFLRSGPSFDRRPEEEPREGLPLFVWETVLGSTALWKKIRFSETEIQRKQIRICVQKGSGIEELSRRSYLKTK